jgi:hypothetical protein
VFLTTCPLQPIPKHRLIAPRFIPLPEAAIATATVDLVPERSLEMYSLEVLRGEAVAAPVAPALVLTTQKPTVLQAVHRPVQAVVAVATAAEAMLHGEKTKVKA